MWMNGSDNNSEKRSMHEDARMWVKIIGRES